MNTDESIWLWPEENNVRYNIFQPGDFREMVSIGNDVPAEFYFRRSPNTVTYER